MVPVSYMYADDVHIWLEARVISAGKDVLPRLHIVAWIVAVCNDTLSKGNAHTARQGWYCKPGTCMEKIMLCLVCVLTNLLWDAALALEAHARPWGEVTIVGPATVRHKDKKLADADAGFRHGGNGFRNHTPSCRGIYNYAEGMYM